MSTLRAEDVYEILQARSVEIHFQPIFSVASQTIVGIESLCRARTRSGPVAPSILFTSASKYGLTVELDRLCRDCAMHDFAGIHDNTSNLTLFLNLDVSIIDQGVGGSGILLSSTRELGLDPPRIVIEIIESRVNDTDALLRFVDTYRAAGFMIAIDDMGSGYSNIERIAFIKPDIIKVDQSIIKDIDRKYYKQEILKSLVGLSDKLGAVIVAEGIETVEEAVTCMDIGAHLLQGYYLGHPQPLAKCCPESRDQQIKVVTRYKEFTRRKMNQRQLKQREFITILNHLTSQLDGLPQAAIMENLEALINPSPMIECGYLLDRQGMQISQTIFNHHHSIKAGKRLFRPATPGQDHSAKPYYYLLMDSGLSAHITEPYISWASGSLCVTASQFIQDQNQNNILLCLDLLYSSE